eukprot:gene6154-biopygen2842
MVQHILSRAPDIIPGTPGGPAGGAVNRAGAYRTRPPRTLPARFTFVTYRYLPLAAPPRGLREVPRRRRLKAPEEALRDRAGAGAVFRRRQQPVCRLVCAEREWRTDESHGGSLGGSAESSRWPERFDRHQSKPWQVRLVARAWRGRGAGCKPFFSLGWHGRGAGAARACPVPPGNGGLGAREPRGRGLPATVWFGGPAEPEGGAGVARAVGIFWPEVTRAWRGHGAGMARALPVLPGVAPGGQTCPGFWMSKSRPFRRIRCRLPLRGCARRNAPSFSKCAARSLIFPSIPKLPRGPGTGHREST